MKRIKAIAKKHCEVSPALSMNELSLNRMQIKKDTIIDLPVKEDKKLTGILAERLGDRSVVFQDENGMLIPTYSKDFEYHEKDH